MIDIMQAIGHQTPNFTDIFCILHYSDFKILSSEQEPLKLISGPFSLPWFLFTCLFRSKKGYIRNNIIVASTPSVEE